LDQAPGSIREQSKEIELVASVHRSLPFPTDDQLCWLLGQGVEEAAMGRPWIIRGGMVQFDDDTFEFVSTGVQAIIFRADDRGETVDLVAWDCRTGRLGSWRSSAFCLGDLDQIFNPATYFMGGALRLHRSPLEWLRADRDGIVIVQPQLAYACLRNACRLSFTDVAHAQQVERWLEPPKPSVELLVEVHGSAAA
jgi:hypothetical protein